MKIKLSKSTILKISAGITLTVTIICTAIAIALIPGAAPIVAGVGSAIALMLGQEVIKAVFNRMFDNCMDGAPTEEQHSDGGAEYAYKYTKTTHTLEKSDSGNHLVEVTKEESGNEHGNVENNLPRTKKPHP